MRHSTCRPPTSAVISNVISTKVWQYIVESRIRAAAEMLCNSRMSVKEIAYRLGYTDSCHLVRSFKHHYGTTPASYRSRHASGQETR
ncbi:MAG: AraC family transcriptional regulator [Alistipes inops]